MILVGTLLPEQDAATFTERYLFEVTPLYVGLRNKAEFEMKADGGESKIAILGDTFPHYGTFAEQGLLVIDLDRERVRALSNLAAWTVFRSAEYIKRGLLGHR